MNKKLMALAVAGALSAPGFAAAQVGSSPGITFYGRLTDQIVLQNFDHPTNKVKKGDVQSVADEIGFRGRENLGGGTSLWFQLATGAWPDARLEGGTTTGNNWGGRNSAVGITSSLGDIRMGIWDTPYKQTLFSVGNVGISGSFGPAGVIMGNGDSTGALPNANCGGLVNNGTGAVRTSGVCVVEVTTNPTSFSKRISNSIQYWSPRMGGVQVKLGTAMYNYKEPENQPLISGMQSSQLLSGAVTYARGPLSLGLGFETHKGFRPGTASANDKVDPTDTGVVIGGKWNFGPGQIGIAFEQLDYDANNAAGNNGMKSSSAAITGRWNVGPGRIWAAYTSTPGGKSCNAAGTPNATPNIGNIACDKDGEAKETGIGYDYILSKRSYLYFAYNKIDNGLRTGYYYIAGPAANAVGTGGALAANTDVTTLAVGIRHTW